MANTNIVIEWRDIEGFEGSYQVSNTGLDLTSLTKMELVVRNKKWLINYLAS